MSPAVTGPSLVDVEEEDARLAVGELEEDLLEVEHDVGDIFDHAGKRGEFMHGAFELDAGDGGAFQRGKEHAAQGVAEGVAVAGLKGFGDELGVVAFGGGLVFCQTIGHFETTETDGHLISPWLGYPNAPRHAIAATRTNSRMAVLFIAAPPRTAGRKKIRRSRDSGTAKIV